MWVLRQVVAGRVESAQLSAQKRTATGSRREAKGTPIAEEQEGLGKVTSRQVQERDRERKPQSQQGSRADRASENSTELPLRKSVWRITATCRVSISEARGGSRQVHCSCDIKSLDPGAGVT